MMFLRLYLESQIKEIREDAALRLYGAVLALGQFLAYCWWVKRQYVYFSPSHPICWPFYENCYKYRIQDPSQIQIILVIFGAFALFCAYLFIRDRQGTIAYTGLVILNICKLLILFQDYRLRENQHYMLFFLTFVFLFLPKKRDLLRYTLVMFYLWAGALKLNVEWLSGKALYGDPLWIHGHWIPVGCAYVLVLEFIISWGLFSSNKFIYWSSFFQFILFHIVSWPVVHFFYPMLMIGLLSIYPLTYFIKTKEDPRGLLKSLAHFKQPVSTYVFIVFFSCLQMIPKFFPGNTAITGEGRLFALHMFDAKVVCNGQMILHYKKGDKRIAIPFLRYQRIKCDPLVYYSKALQLCDKNRGNPFFLDLDLDYNARLNSASKMTPLVNISGFCGKNVHYNMFKHNDWILTGAT